MPVQILIIEKTGVIQEAEIKTPYVEAELYKKAGLKTAKDFELQTEWGAEIDGKVYSVSVFGKTTGRAGQENKYEFPPPIDNLLLFGPCVLVNKVNGRVTDITKSEWTKVYEHLYGGFEDLGDDDSEISEDDEDDDVPRTKEGYVKDDFVVDDDDEYDSESEEEESEEEVVVVKKKRAATKAKAKVVKSKSTTKIVSAPENVFSASNYLNCDDELSEEEYL